MSVSATPIDRRLVSAAVYERLLADVLDGRLAPGDPLPSERTLSEGFAVNRHAVREALKRLQQAGLVRIAQGGATRVADWREEAGLDLLTSLVGVATGDARAALLRDVLELRRCVGVDAARRCAERAPTTDLRAVSPGTGEALARNPRPGGGVAPTAGAGAGALARDPRPGGGMAPTAGTGAGFAERAEAYVAFWAAIVAGAGNLATRLAFNTLVAAQRHGDLDPAIYAAEIDDADAQARLAAAIAQGAADAAATHADALLGRTLDAATSAAAADDRAETADRSAVDRAATGPTPDLRHEGQAGLDERTPPSDATAP